MPIRCTYTKHPDAHNIGVVRIVDMPSGWVFADEQHYKMRLGLPGLQVAEVPASQLCQIVAEDEAFPRVFRNGDGTIELTEAPDA
jgi:hypothetical protein